jgi:hypothetical protein
MSSVESMHWMWRPPVVPNLLLVRRDCVPEDGKGKNAGRRAEPCSSHNESCNLPCSKPAGNMVPVPKSSYPNLA